MFHKIEKCRVCGNEHYVTVLDLGDQYLSGIFPKSVDPDMYRGPLKLVKCDETTGGCGHVQLEHTFDLPTMYGEEYGYRSGLNSSMVKHLQGKYEKIVSFLNLQKRDLVIDIAGNDGTFLGFFSPELKLVSIDPTSKKFSKYFKNHVDYIADFFTEKTYRSYFGEQKAKLITSFSMFYDLEDPCQFAKEVNAVLDPEEGIWVLEQSYMPEMLRVNSFDTVCHEHLSYYGMRQIKYIMDQAGLKIIDFEFNDVNGGSISVVVANKNSKYEEATPMLNDLIQEELDLKLNTTEPWVDFSFRIEECRVNFWKIIEECKKEGLRVASLGASTKGNVTLQTWGITNNDIEVVGEVNPDKDGSFTPGTWIPIKNENVVIDEYDVFVILPWHFKNFFINSLKFKGKKLLFPLPNAEIVIP
ncbi:MAG: methyltransferase domain-containing protein [Alphaproteobacteria bacterium]|nr:methyltransferase domain-containing protein [Alphaproteobacteria bacterium]